MIYPKPMGIILVVTPISLWSNDHQMDKAAYEFSCGELRTKEHKKIRYARYETGMKAPARAAASGYISSLFTYTNEGEPREWEEIDVELEGGNTWMYLALKRRPASRDKRFFGLPSINIRSVSK
jgi:hypothetical protein